MLYVGSCVVYYVTFLILINIALRQCCRYGGDFSVAYLYLPVVAYIVICESLKVIFNVIRESYKFVNVIRDGTPSYRPSY
jgi:hypothetical protein